MYIHNYTVPHTVQCIDELCVLRTDQSICTHFVRSNASSGNIIFVIAREASKGKASNSSLSSQKLLKSFRALQLSGR